MPLYSSAGASASASAAAASAASFAAARSSAAFAAAAASSLFFCAAAPAVERLRFADLRLADGTHLSQVQSDPKAGRGGQG